MIRRFIANAVAVLARPSPLAVLAVAESVACGLLVRHEDGEAALAALFLVPMVAGYRTVAADEHQVGLLPPGTALLLMLGAAVAQGWAAMIFVLVLMPLLMLLALLGGVLASLVRRICRAASRIAETVNPARGVPARRRRGRIHPAARSRADRDRHPAADPRDAWQQIIIRTPL
ncbi:MAG TPA: hypothetical protein VLK84_13870 [Longimicrobium sp.]|nr:hypothetical protein [Longimicrobium sp.]